MTIEFILNNEPVRVEKDPLFPVLRFLREERGLVSVKTGCGEGECGACTVLLGTPQKEGVAYKNVVSCILPIGELDGKHLVTLEGINGEGLSPVQQAFVDEGAVQCGFCTPGFIMSLTGFFLSAVKYTPENIIHAIDGNICRCTGYSSIKRAAEKMISEIQGKLKFNERVESLIRLAVIPEYFNTIPGRLRELNSAKQSPLPGEVSGPGHYFIAGGTDLLVGNRRPETGGAGLISGIKQLTDISVDADNLYIGAGVTVEDLRESETVHRHFPEIRDFMYLISSQIIRNMATIGGNIVNASPIGDLSVLFLALDTVLDLRSGKSVRKIALRDFFIDYKKMDIRTGELIVKLTVPIPEKDRVISFEKVSRRTYLDIASCNSAAHILVESGKIRKCDISAGGVSPVPLYLKKTSEFAVGKTPDKETIDGLIRMAETEISPISDVRGSAWYKRELLGRLIRGHFLKIHEKNKRRRNNGQQ